MSFFSTGPIENNPVGGVRTTQQLTVKIENRDLVNSGTVQVHGYVLDTAMTLYVVDPISVSPSEVVTRNYYANLDAIKFDFTTGGPAQNQIVISVWGKDDTGQLQAAHRVVREEL
ncbi:hypothetical protein [Paenibacillus tuaregi]|uniref:hypothetical protein n=1 Tax=Paenibacillus tuaregi TaxID=1816681 RepID=UPI0008382D2D|nr:hypothetical protein [Paenibacillus tuaregi]